MPLQTFGDQSTTITLRSGDTLQAGNGNDTIQSSGADLSNVVATAGDGASLLQLNVTSLLTGSNDSFTLGNGNDRVSIGASFANSRFTLGHGNDQLLVSDAVLNNDVFTLGNGNDSLQFFRTSGNDTINLGTGSDTIQIYSVASGNITINQAAGGGASIFDFNGSANIGTTITVTNPGDIFLSPPAALTINVAFDGFKAPYAATVKLVATAQAIAAPYNVAQPLPYFVAGLLHEPAEHWTSTIGIHATAPTLRFSFMQALPSYATPTDATGFTVLGPDLPANMLGLSPQQILDAQNSHAIALNSAELAAVTALANWQAVANVNFISAADASSVEFRFGANNQGTVSGAYTYAPQMPQNYFGLGPGALRAADIYMNNSPPLDYGTGKFGGVAMVHEIGHGLGLGGESGLQSDPNDTLPGGPKGGEDTISNSVMSAGNRAINGSYPNAPQIFDIAAIQYLYGPNPNYHPNASHVWGFNSAGGAGDLISDGPGFTNTISAAAATQNAFIDLRAGHWNYLGAQTGSILAPNQLMIDYGTLVQVAIGGAGNDTLVGNDANDSMAGGGGNDLLVVGAGNNTLDGGAGGNAALFADALANYSIVGSGAGVTVSEILAGRQGTNQLFNVQQLQFSDRTAISVTSGGNGSEGDDLLIGTGAADVIFGRGGNDSVSVGGGNAIIVEGALGPASSAENDTITAGDGNNIIWGGAGSGAITVGDGNNLIIAHIPGQTGLGNSTIRVGNGTNTIFAVGGNETIFGGGGTNLINGGVGAVSIVGGAGLTLMAGGAGASTLSAGTGATQILGLSGRDSITGGSGGDTIFASGGSDTVRAGGGKDLVILGAGSESLFTNLGSGAVTVNLGGFSAANQQKTITLGGGPDILVLATSVPGAFAASEVISITGYKVGTDKFILQGLAEHNLAALQIQAAGADTSIRIADVGTILLVGIAAAKIGAADFSFG